MKNTAATQDQINSYFSQHSDIYTAEARIIADLRQELKASYTNVNNKSMIKALLTQLEIESDPVQLDVLRGALEIVVQHTPDDLSA